MFTAKLLRKSHGSATTTNWHFVMKGLAIISLAVVLISGVDTMFTLKTLTYETVSTLRTSRTLRTSSAAKNAKAKNAATGNSFDGKQIRTFNPMGLKCTQSQWENRKVTAKEDIFPTSTSNSRMMSCPLWGVVTTVNAPTESIKRVADLTRNNNKEKWCLVIVGDTKSPDHLYNKMVQQNNHTHNLVYLSAKDQQVMNHALVEAIPYASFARKNIGYLYAIAHGAKAIFDFDDDNVLKPDVVPYSLMAQPAGDTHQLFRHVVVPEPTTLANDAVNLTRGLKSAFNPFPLMHPTESGTWPRGFPLELVKEESFAGLTTKVQYGSLPRSSVGVIQSVCDGDPDVDAIYRLTRPLPFTFDSSREASHLLVPPTSYSPYNAQATVHTEAAFWGLLLPFTVTGRVTDIWRSYFTQRIMQDLQLVLLYSPPMVDHTRSPHNYLADHQAEDHLYHRTSQLLEFLTQWQADPKDFLPARLEKLWIGLYEHDYVGLEDVVAMQNWLIALKDVGYDFPVPINMEVEQQAPSSSEVAPAAETEEIERLPMENQKLREALEKVGNGVSTENTRSLTIIEQPELRGQPFLAGPYYNFPEDSEESALNTVDRPNQLVLKLVMMTKDEWPLLKYWTLYHGELLGFHNLYIIDDSSDPRCTAFLKHARDHWGTNIIFSTANLNELSGEMTSIGKHIKGSSDLMLKMDTDEFLISNKGQTHCVKGDKYGDFNDCEMSPYAMDGFLKDTNDWFKTAKGDNRLRVEMLSMSLPNHNRETCEERNSGDGEEIHHFPTTNTKGADNLKKVYDSRNFNNIDLGSHAAGGGDPVRLGLIHFHYRCYRHEVESSKKAVISHNYINPSKPTEELITKLQNQYFSGKGACEGSDQSHMTSKPPSWHKVWEYAKSLECPEQHKNEFYAGKSQAMLSMKGMYYQTEFNDETQFKVNSEFEEYMENILTKYGTTGDKTSAQTTLKGSSAGDLPADDDNVVNSPL